MCYSLYSLPTSECILIYVFDNEIQLNIAAILLLENIFLLFITDVWLDQLDSYTVIPEENSRWFNYSFYLLEFYI